MDLNLVGRRAVVCGSTRGIGRAIAIQLAEMGAEIVLMARNPERLESVVRELACKHEQQHEMIVADFAAPEQVRQAIGKFVIEKKNADILINNTGGPPGGLAIEANVSEYLTAFNTHLICNQILTQALVHGMKKNQYGRIINIISTSVKQPIPGLGVSNTIRGAVANWAKTLAAELGPFGITVNNLLPGMTRTSRLDSIISNRAEKSGKTVEQVTEELIATIPAGRFAESAEIGNVVGFLASPAASYINGINVPVDGGRTLCL